MNPAISPFLDNFPILFAIIIDDRRIYDIPLRLVDLTVVTEINIKKVSSFLILLLE